MKPIQTNYKAIKFAGSQCRTCNTELKKDYRVCIDYLGSHNSGELHLLCGECFDAIGSEDDYIDVEDFGFKIPWKICDKCDGISFHNYDGLEKKMIGTKSKESIMNFTKK